MFSTKTNWHARNIFWIMFSRFPLGMFCNFKPKPRSEPDSGTDDGIDRRSGQCHQCGSATSYGRHYSYGEYYNLISTLLSITETLTSGYQTCTTAVHNLSVISSSCLWLPHPVLQVHADCVLPQRYDHLGPLNLKKYIMMWYDMIWYDMRVV